jgi:glycosyltransferase involved in cell wall biosynthesis
MGSLFLAIAPRPLWRMRPLIDPPARMLSAPTSTSFLSVVHVIAGLHMGGAETSLARLIENQDSDRFRTMVISLRRGGEMAARLTRAGADIVEIEGTSLLDTLGRWRGVVAQVKALQPAIIHGWMYNGNIAALLLRQQARLKSRLLWNVRASLLGMEGFPLRIRASIRLSALLSRSPEIIVYNSEAGEREHRAIGFNPRAAIVIDNGVDVMSMSFQPQARERIRHEINVQSSAFVVCNIARLDPMKDHSTLLEAAALLRDLDLRFVLVGPGVSMSSDMLRSTIERLRLADKVTLLGSRADVADVLSASDLFCLSSYTEGMPNVVAEAMACELPCVVTDVGDAARLVGETGIVVPPRDPARLAEAIHTMLAAPQELRRTRGRQARARIESSFSIERMIHSYQNLYLDAAARAALAS